jgi:spermidine synthase
VKPDGRFVLLLGCFMLSGMAGLVYETAWTQQFTLSFGASEMAVVAVLAAYMAGLTLGAAAGGRLVSRVRRPVRAYAVLELGVAASALAVPLALRLAQRLQVWLLGGAGVLPEAGSLATILFHLTASFAILAVPTGLMGATLPLLVRFAVRDDEQIGGRVGTLYTVNTVGAAVGALGAAFLLLPRLGLGGTVLTAAALNTCAFLLALPLRREAVAVMPRPPAQSARGYILPLVLVSSAVSFTYEILWTRALTFVLGGSLYAFATMLAVFLAGIGLGSGLASPLAGTPAAARRGFAMAQVGVAMLSLAAYHAVDRLPEVATRLSAAGAGFLVAGVGLSALTLLPGAICVGATFPFAVRALAGEAAEAGPASARVYGWSTIGGVVGAVLGGLVLLPTLRFEGTVAVACATGLLLAAATALVARPRLSSVLALAGLGALGLALWPPRAPWNLLRHSTLPGEWEGDVVYYGVGRGATVLVMDVGWEWRLTSNGLPESAIQPAGARPSRYAVAHWLSLLALAARPSARSLMVVGLGAGKTVEDVPASVASVDVVELEPEIVEANRALSRLRRKDPLADPRVRLRLNDARSALLLTRRRFDAIVSQPSHPWTTGAAHLFTREFFTLVRDRLTDDGVLVQWMGQMFVDESLLRTLLATLVSVFPHVEVYEPYPGGSLLFLASKQPLAVAETAPRAIGATPAVWAAQGVFGAADLLVARVQDEDGVRRVAAGAPVNTDQWNLMQTRAPRILGHPLGPEGSDRVFAPFDPLRREAAGAGAAYIVRRLVREDRLPRARRVAAAMPPGAGKSVALAMVEIAAGHVPRSEAALRAAFAQWPDAPEVLHALLLRRPAALVEGVDPEGVLPRLRLDALASGVLEGWRLQQAGRERGIEALEGILARAGPHDDLFESALRLRIAWRHASGEADRAREALGLLDPFLATGTTAADLLLRARLAALAGEPAAVLASLNEVGTATGTDLRETARAGLAVLEGLPSGVRQDPRAVRIRDRLGALISRGASERPGLPPPPRGEE